MKNILFLTLAILLSLSSNAQRVVSGVVSDSLGSPLESANLMARPQDDKSAIRFAMADSKGRYRLALENDKAYTIRVSYLGYKEEIFSVEAGNTTVLHDFRLAQTGEVLNEIVIHNETRPVLIKKDTIVYNASSFANGDERKMRELLEKLPGVEVDAKGNVSVQGKRVTQMYVEGKSFFGGGSKLAVENIPADAIDKIEVIDHFNEVAFLKQVSDSDDLMMNVKLREDRKRFVFGDVRAGVEAGKDDNGFYLGHAALFYYSPKTNVSFIGDRNNIGQSTLTFSDVLRFEGGASRFLSGRRPLSDLSAFINDNTEAVSSKSLFGALSANFSVSKKINVAAFALFSDLMSAEIEDTRIQYQQGAVPTLETRLQRSNTKAMLGICNVKLDYSPQEKEKFYYNLHIQPSANDGNTILNSTTEGTTNAFRSIRNADNLSLKQYVEWHKNYNAHHTTTFVVNHTFDSTRPFATWFTDAPFLSGLIPLEADTAYTIRQVKEERNNVIDALFRYYWILNDSHHLYLSVGNNFIGSRHHTSERQLLTSGSENDFSADGFGNHVRYELNDAYLGVEYKFKLGKWVNKPGLFLRQDHLATNQASGPQSVSRTFVQPRWQSEYQVSTTESLVFDYKLENEFPGVRQLADRFVLQGYNSVFRGNALLRNERFHAASTRYSKFDLFKGINWNASASFNRKVRTIRNEIVIDGIRQFGMPVSTENPETNWRVYGFFQKKLHHFRLSLTGSLNGFDYRQRVNGVTIRNRQNEQNIGLSVKTTGKKWPTVELSYNRTFNQFKGSTDSDFASDVFFAKMELRLWKHVIWNADYQYVRNGVESGQKNAFDVANAAIRYQRPNKPFIFELFANNLLNYRSKNSYTFSDYAISQDRTFVLPRALMVCVSYKL